MGKIVVETVNAVFLLGGADLQFSVTHKAFAEEFSGVGGIGDNFRNNIRCACQSVLNAFYTKIGVCIIGSEVCRSGAVAALLKKLRGKRLQPLFLRNGCAGATLGAEGTVNILDFGKSTCVVNGIGKLIGELFLSGDGRFNFLSALFQIAKIAEAVFESAQGGVVHTAVKLLAVTGYKRNGVAFINEGDNIFDKFLRGVKLGGEYFDDRFHFRVSFFTWVYIKILILFRTFFKSKCS